MRTLFVLGSQDVLFFTLNARLARDDRVFWGEGGMQKVIVALFGLVSAGFLIAGFRTGRMHCYWSLALNGDASRRSNPAWFWTYAGLNLLIVAGAILLLLV